MYSGPSEDPWHRPNDAESCWKIVSESVWDSIKDANCLGVGKMNLVMLLGVWFLTRRGTFDLYIFLSGI